MNEEDKIINGLFEKLQQKKDEIAKAEKPKWKTHLSFGFTESQADRVNIAAISELPKLVKIASFLLSEEENWNKACKELGEKVPLKWLTYSVSDWIDDIKTRIAKIQIDSKKKEFAVLEEKLNKLVSPERRRQLELAEISKLLD